MKSKEEIDSQDKSKEELINENNDLKKQVGN